MEHPEQPWPVQAVTWAKSGSALKDDAERLRRVHTFLRSRAFDVFMQACHDWAEQYELCPPLVFTWDMDAEERDMVVVEWVPTFPCFSQIDSGLPDGVTSDTALLALSAFCCSRLRTARVMMSVDVIRDVDWNDPDNRESVFYIFTFERRRRRRAAAA